MPKRYEDEIRDLLKGMDRFPGEGAPRRGPAGRRPSAGSRAPARRWWSGLHVDPQRLMGGALILMLFAWIMRGPWTGAFPGVRLMAGYISLVSVVLFLVALVLFIRAGSMGGVRMGGMGGSQSVRWRGQVIEFPRRGGPMTGLRNWWRRTTGRFSRRQSGPNGPFSRGRDTYQW